MKRGFSAVFLIVMLFFLATPVAFYLFSLGKKSEVGGAVLSGASKGFSIEINSRGGIWNLYEYGCADIDECESSLHSGRRISVTSGGNEEHHRVFFATRPSSEDVNYVKFFVKPGWGSPQRTFSLSMANAEGLKAAKFDEDGSVVWALIMPVSYFSSAHFVAGSFSD